MLPEAVRNLVKSRLLAAAFLPWIGILAQAQSVSGHAGPDAIPWRTYKSGKSGGITAPRQLVITNGANWQVYWAEVTGEPPRSAPTDVDFTREQLVAIHLGQRPNPAYEVYVESIRQTSPAQATVHYVEATPPPGQAVIQVLSSPWVIVRMPRVPGVLSFSKRTVAGRVRPGEGGAPCRCCWRCGYDNPVVIGYSWSGLSGWGGSPFDPLNNIQWRTYETGAAGKIDRFETHVIENDAAWQSYWSRNTGNPAEAAPKNIDWVKQRVIAVNLGRSVEAGTNLYVETVSRKRASEIEITYVVAPPPIAAGGAKLLISPYAILTMDRVAGTFSFKRKDVQPVRVRPRKCGCGCTACGCGH